MPGKLPRTAVVGYADDFKSIMMLKIMEATIPQVTPSNEVAKKATIHCAHSILETFHKIKAGLTLNMLFKAMKIIAANVAMGNKVNKLVMNKQTSKTKSAVTML